MSMKPLLLCAALLAAPAIGQVRIDTPLGGWRHSGGTPEQYTQEVNYPASSVNIRPGQSELAIIRGRIGALAKSAQGGAARQEGPNARASRKPATMVVNGIAMPLHVEQDGSFARPYMFGRQSNNVEVRAPDGASRARTQFVEVNPGKTQPRLRVVLSWDSDGTDIDLHVVTPDGGHAWYGERVLANGGALDVDVTTGFGPEIFSSPSPQKGNYHVYVNYYGSGENDTVLTTAQVAIISNENTPSEKQQVFMVPMRSSGELTLVKSFVYP
ncbi:MAG: DUF2135 domain-containing protein [Pseudomonadota bacterium]